MARFKAEEKVHVVADEAGIPAVALGAVLLARLAVLHRFEKQDGEDTMERRGHGLPSRPGTTLEQP